MSPLRIAIALTVILSLTFGTHYYLWARLVRDAALPEPWFRLATALLFLLAASMPTAMIISRVLRRESVAALSWVAYGWMGTMFLLVVTTAGADLARGALSFVRPTEDPVRRLFLSRSFAAGIALVGSALAGSAFYSALSGAVVKRVRVGLAKLPPHLSGYKIVQLSDVHVGPTIDRRVIERVVAKVNALDADLVVITGDLVDGSVASLRDHVAPLGNLRAKDGVFFVTGNHEYYSGADAWIAYLRTLNIRTLRNERVAIRGADGFDLAGVDDHTAHQFGHGADYAKALGGRDESRAVVLLAHQPKQIESAAQYNIDLQLSGHTHGGQIAPFNFLVKLQQPYVAGLYDHGRAKLYVSRGTGYWGPPMRLAAPSEITEIELLSV